DLAAAGLARPSTTGAGARWVAHPAAMAAAAASIAHPAGFTLSPFPSARTAPDRAPTRPNPACHVRKASVFVPFLRPAATPFCHRARAGVTALAAPLGWRRPRRPPGTA